MKTIYVIEHIETGNDIGVRRGDGRAIKAYTSYGRAAAQLKRYIPGLFHIVEYTPEKEETV